MVRKLDDVKSELHEENPTDGLRVGLYMRSKKVWVKFLAICKPFSASAVIYKWVEEAVNEAETKKKGR